MDKDEGQGSHGRSGQGSVASGFAEPFTEDDKGIVKSLLEPSDGKEDIIIDGRIFREGDEIFDLVDVLEDEEGRDEPEIRPASVPEDAVIAEIRAVAERIAREMIPDVAERVIREEIEKLKKGEDE